MTATEQLENETLQQIRELDLQTQHYTALANYQTEAFNKYAALVKATVTELHFILQRLESSGKSGAPDMVANLIIDLQAKAKAEAEAMVRINAENERLSDEVMEQAQKIMDNYNAALEG